MRLPLMLVSPLLVPLSLAAALPGCVDDPGEPVGPAVAETDQALGGYLLVSAETAISTASTKQLSVACPAGTKALGAGWGGLDATSAILRGVATYFAPSFDGARWVVNARDTSGFAQSWKLRVTVVCGSASLTGYEIVTAETALTTASGQQLAPACPSGKRSLGAGWEVLDSTGAILDGEALHFAPSFDGASWLVNARNNSSYSPTWKLRTRLVCVDATAVPGYEVAAVESPVDATELKQLSAPCTAGKHATSLGWAVLDGTGVILQGAARYSLPSFDGSRWLTNATNYSTFAPAWKLRVRAICTP